MIKYRFREELPLMKFDELIKQRSHNKAAMSH